jgi:hypothetical protein
MQLNSSWEAASCAATQESIRILWKPKANFRVHKSPPLAPILSQINPIHTNPSYLLLRSISKLTLGLPSGLFPYTFPTNILHMIPLNPHSCYMPRPSHPSWLDRSNYTWKRVQVTKLLSMHPSIPAGQRWGKKLRKNQGEGNSDTNSPDAGSSDTSSDMKHRTVDGRDGSGETTVVSAAAVLRCGKQMGELPH